MQKIYLRSSRWWYDSWSWLNKELREKAKFPRRFVIKNKILLPVSIQSAFSSMIIININKKPDLSSQIFINFFLLLFVQILLFFWIFVCMQVCNLYETRKMSSELISDCVWEMRMRKVGFNSYLQAITIKLISKVLFFLFSCFGDKVYKNFICIN